VGGLRRAAGLAPLVILAVGIDPKAIETMTASLANCYFESRSFDEIDPEACEVLTPNLAVVNATSARGLEFTSRLWAATRERLLPIVALNADGSAPGADVTLDPASNPVEWAEHIRNLVP
jgi:hypothetical protein